MSEQQLLFGAPTSPGDMLRQGSLGVLTWNIQHAAPKRAWQQVEWLAAQASSDVVILTEVGSLRSARTVAEALTYYGYSPHIPCEEVADYRVIVANRAGELEVLADRPDYLPHRGVVTRVRIDNYTITTVGIYVPSRGPRERRNVAKRAFQDAVVRMLPELVRGTSGGPVLIGGDLNVVEPGHNPYHAVFGEWEYDFYRSFERAGFIDCFRYLNAGAEDHSWYGRSGLGFRFDHLFVDKVHVAQVLSCRYDHTVRTRGLSDHSAMSLTISPITEVS
jgi:exonuclease III